MARVSKKDTVDVTVIKIEKGIISLIEPDGLLGQYRQKGINEYSQKEVDRFIEEGKLSKDWQQYDNLPRNYTLSYEDDELYGMASPTFGTRAKVFEEIVDKIKGKKESSEYVTSRGIRSSISTKCLNPIGIVSIMPAVQIKLGDNFKDFIYNVRRTELPLTLHKMHVRGMDHWNILIIDTMEILCTIVTDEGIMNTVSFNESLVYDEEHKKKYRLSAIHQVLAGKAGDSNVISEAVKIVSLITGEPENELEVKNSERVIVVFRHIRDVRTIYRYTFIKDSRNNLSLLGVGMKRDNQTR